MCSEGSPVIEELEALQGKGTKILVCGTCLVTVSRRSLLPSSVSNMWIADLLATAKPRSSHSNKNPMQARARPAPA